MMKEDFWGNDTLKAFDRAVAAIFDAIPKAKRRQLFSEMSTVESLGKMALVEGAKLFHAVREQAQAK